MKDLYKNYRDENGNIKSFKEQLLEFEYGIKDFYHPFLININSNKLQYAEIKEKPLMINVSTIQKLKVKHELDLKFLIDLEKITENSIFAFNSIQYETSKIFVTDKKNDKGFPVIFIIRENEKEYQMSINKITSMYDKKNLQNLIDRTLEKGGTIYINPEKEKEFEEMGFTIKKQMGKRKFLKNKEDKEKER